jgi:radical SAM protein
LRVRARVENEHSLGETRTLASTARNIVIGVTARLAWIVIESAPMSAPSDGSTPNASPSTLAASPGRRALLREGIRHPFDEHPLIAIWELTQACDLACVHCRACATPERDAGELSTAEGKRVLDEIAAMGTPVMVLTGGDPAKRPDLTELIAHGARAGLAMAVTPSGTPLMTRSLLAEMRDAGMARLAVSIDGPDAAVHDAFRRVEGSFAHATRILADARDLGVERQVNTTLGPHNFRSLPLIAKLAADVEAALWSVFVVVPTGRAGMSLLLGPNAMESILSELSELAERAPFDVKTTAAPHFRRIQLERRSRGTPTGILRDVGEDGQVRGPRGINDGAGFLFVSHRGDIYPSGFLPVRAGNVRTDRVAEVYRSSPLFRQLRDGELSGKCGACPFRRVCGGSRARAYAMTGDFLASDPLCAYVPKGWTE